MTTDHKRNLLITPILTALMLCLLLFVAGAWLLLANVSVTGTATLPNGEVVDITAGVGGFGVAENRGSTQIEIAGRKFEFDASAIVVDGVKVGVIDDSVKQLSLTANHNGVTLVSGGKTIAFPD